MKELALHILDIAENSVSAGANTIGITLVKVEGQHMTLRIIDDGKGMDAEELKRVSDPFFTSRTTRKVGMGIPLLKQHAEMAEGNFSIQSEPGKGTELKATFRLNHPDRQPLGDLEGVWLMLLASFPGIEWELELRSGQGEFAISSAEIKAALEVELIAGRELTDQLKRMIRNNIDELGLS